jgi:hypothetical protein
LHDLPAHGEQPVQISILRGSTQPDVKSPAEIDSPVDASVACEHDGFTQQLLGPDQQSEFWAVFKDRHQTLKIGRPLRTILEAYNSGQVRGSAHRPPIERHLRVTRKAV